MKLNNKGFTLVEILAVVIILGILTAFMYPNVSKLIEKNKEDNYKQIEKSIETATKIYLSDYRYEITVNDTNITNINGINIIDNNIYIFTLVNEGNIKTNKEGMIINPKNKEQCLNLFESYIKVKYDSNKKDFIYGYLPEEPEEVKNEKLYLKWESKEIIELNGDVKINSNCYTNNIQEETPNNPDNNQEENKIYIITLDNQEATEPGTSKVYLKYNDGVYLEETFSNKMTVNGEAKIIIPTKIGYTFGGYYKKTNGEGNQMITKDGVITENFTNTAFSSNENLYASWIKNEVTIKYNVNGGTIKEETQDNGVVYKWKTDNSGLIYKDNNILETKINYGETLDKNGLKNYNNEKYLFITKKNNIGVKNAEWKCISGCSQIGKTFDQSITYADSDFCDTTRSNCTVVLNVNWINTYKIKLDNQGATVGKEGTTTIYGKGIEGIYLDTKYEKLMTTTQNPISIPKKTGYVFSGYYTSKNGEGEQLISPSGKLTNNFTANKYVEDTIIYAKWIPNIGIYLLNTEKPTSLVTNKIFGGIYRFQGTVANNYICFGTTNKSTCTSKKNIYMYRIIGITSNGQLKLIKKSSLNSNFFDSGEDGLSPSQINTRLNNNFYNNETYIPQKWKEKIELKKWKSGKINHPGDTLKYDTNYMYSLEEALTNEVSNRISIMYISDILFASTTSTGTSTVKNSWIFLWTSANGVGTGGDDRYEWLRFNSNNGTWLVNSSGHVNDGSGYANVRPVFYPIEDAIYISGKGTIENPFLMNPFYNS